jgi:hypothetical protein
MKKRQNIDLKNQAEALCFEAEKNLVFFKDNISEEQQNITKIIEDIRQEIQNDDFEVKTS